MFRLALPLRCAQSGSGGFCDLHYLSPGIARVTARAAGTYAIRRKRVDCDGERVAMRRVALGVPSLDEVIADAYGMREERGSGAPVLRSPSIAAATLAPSVPAAEGASLRARPIKYAIMNTSPAPVVCTSATT